MDKNQRKFGIDTLCVHSGGLKDQTWGGIASPIINSTAYRYREIKNRGYPRYFEAPNQIAVVEKMCKLEHTEDGILVSSGMAAISSTILGLVKTGQHIIIQEEAYGGTTELFTNICGPLGIKYSFVKASVEAIMAKITDQTAMIFLECPTNPTLSIIDIARLIKSIKGKNIITAIDNTFATPINQNPALLGIDIVTHSGTKFLSGHSDLCCGIVLGAKNYIEQIRITARSLGGSLNANDSYLLERSLKTLNLRVSKQTDNAQKLAEFLYEHSEVTSIKYPGLETDKYHKLAKNQMHGFGSMISFELSEECDLEKFMEALDLIIPASSLGGLETTISQVWYSSHQFMPVDQRIKLGINERLLRISTGIEYIDDLIHDLNMAIQKSFSG